MNSIVTNEDCMVVMARYPDKYFDLAVVDPPYGIGLNEMRLGKSSVRANGKTWDERPSDEYWKELMRVSRDQIVWGGNHFCDKLPISRGWIYWDKDTNGDFSDGELA